LLAVDINVITVMDIQHVESLNPTMGRLTSIDVCDTGTPCVSRLRPRRSVGSPPAILSKLLDNMSALLGFAREHGIIKVVLGCTHQPLWRGLLKSDATKRLLNAAADFDIEIAGGDERAADSNEES
jgi:K+-sensing histidine kinase KdpD